MNEYFKYEMLMIERMCLDAKQRSFCIHQLWKDAAQYAIHGEW